jgi:enamine deaminase RidA (YjgF/YER057c/UK114 family)
MSAERGGLPVHPSSWAAPKGYSNGILAPAGGRLLFVAGQVGWDAAGRIVSDRFDTQFDRALANVLEVVAAAGGEARDLAQLTIFVTDKREYLAGLRALGRLYRERMGSHYPAMALVQVAGLVEDGAKVEIQAVAVLPAADGGGA